MSSTRDRSRLTTALDANRALYVTMWEVEFLEFDNHRNAIGTRGLGSCSVVSISSPYGAILAHIPPLPPPEIHDPEDLRAGDRNALQMARRVCNLYAQERNFFPRSQTHIVVAKMGGEVALPEQLNIFLEEMQRAGLSTRVQVYDIPVDRRRVGNGEMLIDAKNRANRMPHVFLQDALISNTADEDEEVADWIWDERYRKWKRFENGQWRYYDN